MPEPVHDEVFQKSYPKNGKRSPFSIDHTWYDMGMKSLMCEGCGTIEAVAFPIPMEEMGRKCLVFYKAHRKCKPKKAGENHGQK